MTISLGVLLMVKNEQDSIATTIQSVCPYVDQVLVYDTGSQDNTIQIIKDVCKKNDKLLSLKQGIFTTFPQSRNEALEFAETFPLDFLLLMDAGDELQTSMKKKQLCLYLHQNCIGNCFLICQDWLESELRSHHYDIRLIRNKKKLRYDLCFPVHEKLKGVSLPLPSIPEHVITLYQNRNLYGKKTMERLHRDIDILLKATPNRRNYYFLAQSYMSIEDFENGYLYNKKYFDLPPNDNVDERIVYTRIAYCAIMCKKDACEIIPVLQKVIDEYLPHYLDAYIYLFKYCIDNNQPSRVMPYVKELLEMEKEKTGMVSHYFYDYLRFHHISIVCLMTNQKLELGYQAIQKILCYQKPNDLHNYKIYQQIFNEKKE